MSLRGFIKKYRSALDIFIRYRLNDPIRKLNDNDRREWILNDEELYKAAKRNGVRL